MREVAVVGRPDRHYGASLHAFVVAASGATLDRERLLAACRSQLSAHKVPRDPTVVDVLPRNASGKVLKAELRERLLA